MKTKILAFVSAIIFLSSCGNSKPTLPSVTGTQFEVLVVMPDSSWRKPSGRSVVALLNQDMNDLPQSEPVMDLHHCTPVQFDDVLKPSRNIVLAEVSPKFSTAKVIYGKDKWATPQTIVKITAPDDSSFTAAVKANGDKIVDYFVSSERERLMAFNKDNVNDKAQAEVERMFGVKLDIPMGISKITEKKDFFWITNDQPNVRQDIVVYSYPYTDKNTFTEEYLIHKRDSVMKANIPGELKGSYMGTELKYAYPSFREISVNGGYAAELRGLWKMMDGAAMGGPFYSLSRVDEIHQRVITIEGFVFAPGKKKRNPIRQLEAVVHSAKLPQEINAIKEVSVVADKKKK